MNEVRKEFDVLVIGGGPAGMAAAAAASAECGVRVGVVDDNLSLGGQIWRGESENRASEAASRIEKIRAAGVELLCGVRIFDQPEDHVLRGEDAGTFFDLTYSSLVLATGARERFLPFPGWTLPNVMGAGGLQALVKSGLPISGKRVVVAGTGPLLLAVASYLRKHGAEIVMICEQASRAALARFGLSLLRHPQKVAQGLSLRKDLAGIPVLTGCWPVSAEGSEMLESVTISRRPNQKIACDYLACGFHLVPNTELPSLLGCRLRDGYAQVDDLQQTTVPRVFCAGEPTGIGGVELSLIEGQIAGLAAAGRGESAQQFFGARAKARRFARSLDGTFALRSELKRLPSDDTFICRCEDVPYGRLKTYVSWRAAKLQTRCGMGPCQGRVCGPAVQFLLNWAPDSVRPPVFPAVLENLAAMACSQEAEHGGAMRGPQ